MLPKPTAFQPVHVTMLEASQKINGDRWLSNGNLTDLKQTNKREWTKSAKSYRCLTFTVKPSVLTNCDTRDQRVVPFLEYAERQEKKIKFQ
jgi:hypothetical protein